MNIALVVRIKTLFEDTLFSPSNRARAEFPLSFPLLSCSSSESVSASKLFEGTSFLAFGCLDLRIFVHQPIRWCLHYLYRFLRRTFGLLPLTEYAFFRHAFLMLPIIAWTYVSTPVSTQSTDLQLSCEWWVGVDTCVCMIWLSVNTLSQPVWSESVFFVIVNA